MPDTLAGEDRRSLAAALAREERAGVELATYARMAALAVIAVWVIARAVGPARIYYLAIISAFALFGIGQLLLRRRAGRLALLAGYGLVLLDMAVLTVALVLPNPLAPEDWPAAMQLRLGNFDFFYIFIGFAVLGFSPGLALWAGAAAATAWSMGVLWVLFQADSFTLLGSRLLESGDLARIKAVLLDPDYVSLEIWVQQVIVALLVAGILALAVWRSRRLALQQARLARERANLARYFSPGRAEELARSAEPIGAVRQQPVAVLFADIVGFTQTCETLRPAEVIGLLRGFHRRMAAAVFEHGGTLEKYIGDAVMATFGTPRTTPNDAANALACSRAMIASIAAWNTERRARGEAPVRIGIGAHYGEVVFGDIGDERCMEFAVVGDTVNVASHLEQLCRSQGGSIAVSGRLLAEARAARAGDALAGFVPIEPQRLKGRSDLLEVWILADPAVVR